MFVLDNPHETRAAAVGCFDERVTDGAPQLAIRFERVSDDAKLPPIDLAFVQQWMALIWLRAWWLVDERRLARVCGFCRVDHHGLPDVFPGYWVRDSTPETRSQHLAVGLGDSRPRQLSPPEHGRILPVLE